MINKYAYTECSPLTISKQDGMVKTASGKVLIEPNSDKAKVVEAAIKKHPNALFFRSKAIKADEINQNSDLFPYEELKKAYKTFEGVPFFTNHDNQHVEHAKGKNIFAEWNEDEKSVYVISFVDRDAYPHLCRSIEEGYVTGVSMGAAVEYSVCSICGNHAERSEDFCSHITERKGRKFSGTVRNVNTGEMVSHQNADVYETNYGLKFIELSAVVDPACPSCHIEGIISNEDYLKKVANLENSFRMVKTASIEKHASQSQIDQIEEALGTLESIAVSLIQKRKQVEPEFAGDLVEIMTSLQEWLEELVGAGYASLPEDEGMGEGLDEGMGDLDEGLNLGGEGDLGGDMGGDMGLQGEEGLQASPVAEETDLGGGVGSVSGLGSSAPKAPITTPVRPKTSKINDVLVKAAKLTKRMNVKGDDEMAKRRVLNERNQQKQQTIEILSNTWKEKQELSEYMTKVPTIQKDNLALSVKKDDESFVILAENKDTKETQAWRYEDLTKPQKEKIIENPRDASNYFLNVFAKNLLNKGENRMADINKNAGATSSNESPEVITQKQLDQKGLYHERTGVEQDTITQDQLKNKRSDKEPDVVTQKQLDNEKSLLNKRQNEERDVVTEGQLDRESASPRTGVEKETITQDQLDKEGYRTNKEQDQVTERQLDNIHKAWERFASRNPSQFKTSREHMGLVVEAAAKSVAGTGCTPSEICKIAGSMVSSTKSRFQLMSSLCETDKEYENVDFSKRMAFWKNKNLKVAGSTKEDISKTFIRELRKIAADQTINPDVLIDAVDVIGDGEYAEFAVSKQVDKILESSEEEDIASSVKADLRDALNSYVETPETTSEERDQQREQLVASSKKSVKTGSKNSEKTKEDAQAIQRKATREQWKKILNKTAAKEADYVVETSFDEMGIDKKDSKKDPEFKKKIIAFTKGAMASQNVKVSSITNVTIDGDTIQIAVQTDGDSQEVNIPIGNREAPEASPLEEDLTGEGYSSDFEQDLLSDVGGKTASKKSKLTKKAQSPMGGGDGTGGDGVPSDGPAMPGAAGDVGSDPISALTSDEVGGGEDQDVPAASKQLPPWCVCPITGSSDVDVEVKEDGSIVGVCKESGVEFEALMKSNIEFKILNPLDAQSGGGSSSLEEPEGPEVPALPVAAKINLNKNNLLKIGNNLKTKGHVCPGCGKDHCKVETQNGGNVTYKCASCGTSVNKDIYVDSSDPEKGYMQIDWLVFPDVEGCSACEEKAKVYAGRIKADQMIREASSKKDDFPTANCVERLARKYGGDAVGSYGPCKGKRLAECICEQLQKLGLRKVRHMEKLASVAMQKDERDVCIEEQIAEGATKKEAETLCGCLQAKYADNHDKFLIQALKEDVEDGKESFDLTVLAGLQDAWDEQIEEDAEFQQAEEMQRLDSELEQDIGADLPPEEFEEEEIEVSIPRQVANDLADAIEEANMESESVEIEIDEISEENVPVDPVEVDVSVDQPIEEEIKGVHAMESAKVKRNAGVNLEVESSIKTPERVKDVESTLNNVPRKHQTLGQEGKENIDVPLNQPKVPRKNETLGKEGKDNIDVNAAEPTAPVDSSYMGHEKEVQKDMPEINNRLKGTVIAKKMKEVDTVVDDVEAGVPRGDATLGNEGPDNIDVKENDPKVPRKNERLGKEGPDNIDVDADSPDVPIGGGEMGHEKEVQKDMPATNDRYLKRVEQERKTKIVEARKEEATQVAAWLAANGRIKSDRETIKDVVQILSNFEIDKIEAKANTLFPKLQKQASREESNGGHSIPAMKLESKYQEKENEITKLSSFIDHWGDKFKGME